MSKSTCGESLHSALSAFGTAPCLINVSACRRALAVPLRKLTNVSFDKIRILQFYNSFDPFAVCHGRRIKRGGPREYLRLPRVDHHDKLS